MSDLIQDVTKVTQEKVGRIVRSEKKHVKTKTAKMHSNKPKDQVKFYREQMKNRSIEKKQLPSRKPSQHLAYYRKRRSEVLLARSKNMGKRYEPIKLPASDVSTPELHLGWYRRKLQKDDMARVLKIKGLQGGNVDFCPNRATMFKRVALNIQNLKNRMQSQKAKQK